MKSANKTRMYINAFCAIFFFVYTAGALYLAATGRMGADYILSSIIVTGYLLLCIINIWAFFRARKNL